MSDPKMAPPQFKSGDAVQYDGRGEVFAIIYGPLEPLRRYDRTALFAGRPNEWCYVLDTTRPGESVVPEGRLTRAERWEPCPYGEHRHRTTHGIWEPGVMERHVE